MQTLWSWEGRTKGSERATPTSPVVLYSYARTGFSAPGTSKQVGAADEKEEKKNRIIWTRHPVVDLIRVRKDQPLKMGFYAVSVIVVFAIVVSGILSSEGSPLERTEK